MQFVIFSSLSLLTIVIVFFFGQSLENSYNEKALDLKVTTVENQCTMIANQIVSVNFLINDTTNSVSTQIDQLAVSLDFVATVD